MGCFGKSKQVLTPFVVRNCQNKRNLIKCSSFDQLISEYRRLYKVPKDCEVGVYDEDATQIDDTECLLALQPYTVLSVLYKGEEEIFISPSLLHAVTRLKTDLSHESQKLLSSTRAWLDSTRSQCSLPKLGAALSNVSDPLEEGTHQRALLDSSSEDPHWFEKVRALKATSKKEVLRNNAKRRIKGYYYKTKEDLLKTVAQPRVEYLFNEFMSRLQQADFNGSYFQREHTEALCCSKGWFGCQGAFDKESCSYSHCINPYARPEDYLMFSTWNLDHQVERSRSVVPSLRSALQERPHDINITYFYNLLFTRSNLRLVHVICHLKITHVGMECDPNAVFVQSKKASANRDIIGRLRQKKRPRLIKKSSQIVSRQGRVKEICELGECQTGQGAPNFKAST
ncbi:DNA fragmentation factor subunit beta-like isoform X1 [Varroa jacobsoni]|uniref:DNA fragmentation factor subunit beta-like isoform X1 n=1 Tax=Varroa jacobsoni TaxID=62625 RepID=UPI000BF8E159|nr:DNA fragmentation factor subunit beta-like isoform X1 [Varroa jacobsoni]